MTCTSPIVYLFVFFNICKIVILLKYNKVVVVVVVVVGICWSVDLACVLNN